MGVQRGSVTVFFALSMMTFLIFQLVLIEGVRNYFLRAEALQAMELTEFSVLSEYQYELFQNYGVFFLDLDYEQGEEHTALLERRAEKYLMENTEEIMTADLTVKDFRRATDADGQAFFEQAVESMKVKSGYIIFEELTGISDHLGEGADLGKILEESQSEVSGLMSQYVDEEGKSLFEISLPEVSFPSVDLLTEAVFGNTSDLSGKEISLSERIAKRTRKTGCGEKKDAGLVQTQLFHGYLFAHMNHYGKKDPDLWADVLEYQMEYIISGESSDRKNLENVMWRIFILRAGGNYLLFHQDAQKMAEAEGEAAALAGITGNPAIIQLVREILLISKAIEAGVEETKSIFSGEKVPFYENGVFSGIQMGYEQYLYLFLNTMDKSQKVYRCMDVVELETREKCGYGQLRLDHCVDSFWLEWKLQFESLFLKIPLLDGEIYETTIKKQIFYKK